MEELPAGRQGKAQLELTTKALVPAGGKGSGFRSLARGHLKRSHPKLLQTVSKK